ncbi:DUF6292 family protein [Streptomyces brasiliensis]|uniref:Uncharacterized protein n=1 Tax=Streptomyces brasiliensis TaxID=1954 RepID=A0A917P5X7_9ACTN|nr:DUF6292 family protein [Streptomyces brasiliensis]GGJ63193.1 hypothetical protein GCM10010121_087380 [Streptomyces brasiliensis]
MILNPPGLTPGSAERLPHWPYVQAVDHALTLPRGIPPGKVRAACTPRERGRTMYIVLVWDISRTVDRMSEVRFYWHEETGWAWALLGVAPSIASRMRPIIALHRVFAVPQDVAGVAERIVHRRLTNLGEYGAEWDRAPEVRATIDLFRTTLNKPGGMWTGNPCLPETTER